ncbi:TniB family NTP-binding protein, partial [Paraburkholderia mimosarum]|uniref:TniB family NTP-binding protein n=2 Tax=Paraburkholderia mimosarum TaxID=312026 RepID=UPI001FD627E6
GSSSPAATPPPTPHHRPKQTSTTGQDNCRRPLQISMVLVGTRDAVLALQSDTQMYSRYRPFEIPRWRESDGLRRLLAAFERVLPLRKPSDLTRREIVQFVLSASGGLTGEISTLLNDAAELSIRSGDEFIGLSHLEHVARDTV